MAAVFYTGELAMMVWLLVRGARLPMAAQKADSDMINNGMATRVARRGPAMMETRAEGSDWKKFMSKHWGAFLLLVAAFVLVLAGAVYVFWWFTGNAQSTGLVPSTLGFWTIGNLLWFIVYAVFWELLLVGIPVVLGVVVAWQWWKRLPADERMGYHIGRRSKRAGGSGGVSFLFFIAFCIKVYLDGNWNVPIASFSLNYVVGSIITILAWVAVVFGIPAAIAVTWWVRREMKKP